MFNLGKKTTATVMAGFQRVLSDLREVEENHAAEAEQHRIAAEQSQAAREAAAKEAALARQAAGRIEILLGSAIGAEALNSLTGYDHG
jgi:copper homeostasis protein CutC